MFSLNQLTQFVAVAEEMHFGRAANRLRMTQPPLSRQIQLLEKDLDVLLFDRSSRAVKLTPAGKAFLADARRLLQQSERVALSVRKTSQGRTGILRVGFTGGSVYSGLETVLTSAQATIEDVEVELRELVTMDQLEALSEGSLDLGLVRPPLTRPDLASHPLLREPLVVAIPIEHELAGLTRPVDVTDLHGVDVVMYTPIESRYFFELLSSVFHEASVAPVVVQYMHQFHSMLALVNLGWGLALVPESASKMHFDGVTYRPLTTPRPAQVELDLVWRIDNENPALARLLAKLVAETPADPAPQAAASDT
ncbi:LysR family transcriptional regulator [Rhodococcus sp. NCIMB 12038]|uniref:LysR family transcriptional regulator n=1 Tax=Rhodococcus sp. NCIMB 12038 TaxID=933800 RepID=UPI000B3C2E07|nr:LysR family transcriptional regulator [Rhodococcus sp. NCIMB 12038]OUS92616.1 LysR family transcriptional regulator [Rhodococcus sp. NCIMB 12038]